MMIAKKDYDFISELASLLGKQQTRRSDNIDNNDNNVVLFKIADEKGKEEFCLTRKSLEKYNEVNKYYSKKITGILKADSVELAELLEIIKRNF